MVAVLHKEQVAEQRSPDSGADGGAAVVRNTAHLAH